MKVAFMFPGQGSQYVGMGKSLYTEESGVKKMFVEADQALDLNLSEMTLSGFSTALTRTENTQPAILLVSSALWFCLKQRLHIKDYCMIGHSLGEYSAYVASGRLAFVDAIKLVRHRGMLMATQPSSEYGMSAVLKLSMEDVSEVLKSQGNNEVFIANDNSPRQVVISGLKTAIAHVSSYLESKGGKLVSLDVSGAFHSPFMKKAAQIFSEELATTTFLDSSVPLYTNLTALPLKKGEERESLTQQIFQPVRFRESIQNMIQDEGITHFVEVGPGKVLQGLVKKIDPQVTVLGIESLEDIEKYTQEGL